MQKLLLISLTLISAQAIAMQLGTIKARVSSTAARLAGAKKPPAPSLDLQQKVSSQA